MKEGRIDDSFIKMLIAWRRNSGFNVHHEMWIQPGDTNGIENLAQYIKKIWNVDLFLCRHSRGPMKVISFLENKHNQFY